MQVRIAFGADGDMFGQGFGFGGAEVHGGRFREVDDGGGNR
jgi:hypothetical protein